MPFKISMNLFSTKKYYDLIKLRNFSIGLNRFNQQTIYAIATGVNQKCGLAVVRVSGKNSLNIMSSLTKMSEETYEPRKMYLRNIWHPITQEKIDKSIVVWFKGLFNTLIKMILIRIKKKLKYAAY